jgi:hypothetical protein
MSSSELQTVKEHTELGTIAPLLDAAFGFFVWAVHFLAIYVTTALACQLGLGGAEDGTRASFITVLSLVTLIAAAVVGLHGVRRRRQLRDVPEGRFRMALTLGTDAIATVAILWQLFALLLVPLCT